MEFQMPPKLKVLRLEKVREIPKLKSILKLRLKSINQFAH